MDATEHIQRFTTFLEENYYAELLEKRRKGENWLPVDFSKLAAFDPELADQLLEQPEEGYKAAEIAAQTILELQKPFTVRFRKLPESQRIFIRNIRSENLNKFYFVEAIVRQKSDVRPQITTAKFECPSCGSIFAILQLDTKFKEPTKCSCGRKGKFRMISKELCDAQGLVLEEIPEQLEGGEQPKRVNAFLKNDLVSPMSEKRTNPGSRIISTGVVKEVPIILRSGGQSTRFDLIFEANSVEGVEEDFLDIKITPEEEEEIKKLSKDPFIWNKMITSIAPSIYGHDKIKEALILQLLGGVRKKREDGVVTRGDIHVLLVGDPGGGKSQLLKRMSVVAPKARFVSGKGASATGLTATVVKDEFLQGWSLEAGALVLANKGCCMIDELDKMTKEDTWAMHEAMEQQQVSVSKANIQASLRCETTVLAAANPKFGRFDPYDTIANQINLPPTLINRFDLIFPIKDLPDPAKDEKMATFVLALHQTNKENPELSTKFLRKYLAYARQHCTPKLTNEAIEEIKEYYIKMRQTGTQGGTIKSIPISARQLEGLIRLSEASSKLRLADTVTKTDSQKAIELVDYCLRQVALDEETGLIDIDRIATDMPASKRNKIMMIKEILVELESAIGKVIPHEEVIKTAAAKGMLEHEVEELLQKLRRSGDIFEPKPGFLSRI